LAEVLNHFDVEPNRGSGVAMSQQMLDERDKGYGKMVGCYSLTSKGALENLLDHSEARNALCFQDSATLPPPPNCRQMQTKKRLRRKVTFA
jgi:hypothetical protein